MEEEMQQMQHFQPEGFISPTVPLSHGVRAGDLLFVSGQIATSPDGTPFIGDFVGEVNGALDNLEAVLSAAGATLQQVAKVSAFLSNAVLFAPFNEIYSGRFGEAPPARTTLVVNFGHPDVRVEIEAIAYLG